jgi:hypothetical protein
MGRGNQTKGGKAGGPSGGGQSRAAAKAKGGGAKAPSGKGGSGKGGGGKGGGGKGGSKGRKGEKAERPDAKRRAKGGFKGDRVAPPPAESSDDEVRGQLKQVLPVKLSTGELLSSVV